MDAWLDRLRKELKETTEGLCETDWSRAPVGRWNSAQILEHLGRTYGTTAKMLELATAVGGPPQVRSGTIPERIAHFVVLKCGFLPPAKSPTLVLPTGDSGPVALERALRNLERMDAAIMAAERRWGAKKPIALHPMLGPLNSTEWRKFHYLHTHHHMKQVRQRNRAANP